MRTISYFSEIPSAIEMKVVPDGKQVFIREDIHQEPETEDGIVAYSAVEYSVHVSDLNFEVTADFIEKVKAEDYARTAKTVRAIRDKLLADSDYMMLTDVEKTTAERNAWKTYRQALRDIPEQEGFPYDVVYPVMPTR